MPPNATSMRALAPAPPARPRQNVAFLRPGIAGAISLAAWSIAGVIGAAAALLPVAFEGGPRGRVRAGARIGRAEPATPVLVAGAEPEEPAARAAGEAYPR